MKYLGVYLDEYFSWEHQIKHIIIKVNKNIGIINKLRHYVDLKMLIGGKMHHLIINYITLL